MTTRRAVKSAMLILALVLPTLARAEAVRGRFERRPRVAAGPVHLDVETASGDVTIRTGPPGAVHIEARIEVSDEVSAGDLEQRVRAVAANPPIRQDGNHVTIDVLKDDEISIDYEITVPADTRIRAQTGSGNFRIRGLRRGVDLRTGSGDVELDGVAGRIRLQTGSGDVRGRAVAGPFDLHTGSGDVEVSLSAPGLVRIATGSGEVKVEGVNGGLSISTGSGSVAAQGVPAAAWRIATASGDVDVRFPPETSFDLDARSSTGDIDVDRAMATTSGKGENRNQVVGRVGRGGPLVQLRTVSGDVELD